MLLMHSNLEITLHLDRIVWKCTVVRESPTLVRILHFFLYYFFLYYNVELLFRRYESGINKRIDFVFFDCNVGINITDVTEEKQSNC